MATAFLDPTAAHRPRSSSQASSINNLDPLRPSASYVPDRSNLGTANTAVNMPPPHIGAGRHRKPRKLVLCFDGTGNKFKGDDSDSNILKIFRMLDRTADDQYHYYQPGIGTYIISQDLSRTSLRGRVRSWMKKAQDSAIGTSFDQHVVGGYRFLMRYYNPGDEIYIFGFSRGAYIARFLAEMLDYVGLLSHGNEEMVGFAWKTFSKWQARRQTSDSASTPKQDHYDFMTGFRETFSRPVRRIRFLGLFDTVNSVPRFETAWMERSKFPYTAHSSAKVIRHAVSIDERRAKFRQDLVYQTKKVAEVKKKMKSARQHGHVIGQVLHDALVQEKHRYAQHVPDARKPSKALLEEKPAPQEPEERGRRPTLTVTSALDKAGPAPYRAHSRSRSRTTVGEGEVRGDNESNISRVAPSDDDGYDTDDETVQDIDEVWFSGGHADIGGGWEITAGTKSASHIPLVWMVREAMRAGLTFDTNKVIAMGCAEALEDMAEQPHDKTTDHTNGPEVNFKGVDFAAQQQPCSAVPPILRINSDPLASNSPDPSSSSAGGLSHAEPQPDDPKNRQTRFHQYLDQATTARLHDSLTFDCGMGVMSVATWKFMEYLPFRRMDLRGDGTWKPIRWPLPCGETRDIPYDARVHGSVIRRMERDKEYRPGNLIVGGGGRGIRRAPEELGMGEWECVAQEGDPVGEIWMRKGKGRLG